MANTPKFKEGDHVVMTNCGEATHYGGRIWTCRSDSFIISSGDEAVFLHNFSGTFLCKCLAKVNVSEIVICAAVKFLNDKVDELIIRGHRHADCFSNMRSRPDKNIWEEGCQGFMTSRNRFVNRAEGYDIQIAAGIKSADPYQEGYVRKGQLYSEDLY